MTHDLVIAGTQLGDIGVTDGSIAELAAEIGGGRARIDARGSLVLPGAIDAHVHLNDPGRAGWEGFESGTLALAAGGTTCLLDMPLNSSPPTVDGAAFDAKVTAARGRAAIDFALWGGIVPGDVDRLDELADRGVVGFKAFMCPSGIDDFAMADELTLARAMERAARLGLPVAVHAEDAQLVAALTEQARADGRRDVRAFLDSRPIEAECRAIASALELARAAGCALPVVHVSSSTGNDADSGLGNTVPFDERPPTVASGVRIGTPAATMRGFDEADFHEVGEVIVGALTDSPDINALRSRSEALCAKRPLYPGFRGYTTYVA